jgi:L-alanine-DL-glutamate epimerase-like enolase superfamily enzyme
MCSTPLEVAGLAQLAGCFEADLVGWMEWPDYSSDGRSGTHPFALAEQMLQTPQSIEQGELILPEGPGLGVKVNEAVIRRFPYRTGPCSSFQPTGA